MGTQRFHAVFHRKQLKNLSFCNLFFGYCDHLKSPFKVCKACFRLYLHVFDPILLLAKRGVLQGIGTQPANAVFHPGQPKNVSFRNLFL